MTLIDRLLQLSRLWCDAQGRSASRLATIVANDGKLLTRLEEGKTCTIETFEKFLVFFREPANWPEESIPADAAALLDEVEMIATGGDATVGKEMQISAHDLMVARRSHDWPIQSANNGGENIGAEADSPVPFPGEAQARPPAPPCEPRSPRSAIPDAPHAPSPFRSSPTCSQTSAPRSSSPESLACSTAGAADAA